MAGRFGFFVLSTAKNRKVESAGCRYLQIVAPLNEVVGMFNRTTDDSFKGTLIQALSMVLSVAITEMEESHWPSKAQVAVNELSVAMAAVAAAATSLIASLTDDAAAVFVIEVEAMTDASAKVREVLGLPITAVPQGAGRSSRPTGGSRSARFASTSTQNRCR